MRFKLTPKVHDNPLATIGTDYPDKAQHYLDYFSPVDKKGRYLYYDDLKYRIPAELDSELVWSIVKLARNRQKTPVIELGEPTTICGLIHTPTVQKAISETDRNATSASLEWISNQIGERAHIDYLLKIHCTVL